MATDAELRQEILNYLNPKNTEDLGGRTSEFFNLLNDSAFRQRIGLVPVQGGDVFQRKNLKPSLGEIFDFDKEGFTEDFLKAGPKEGYFFEGQADKIQKALGLLDRYESQGTIDPLQRQLLQRALERAKEGQKISFNLQNSPYFQGQSGVVGFPEFQVASLGDPTGILSSTAAQTAAGQTPVQQAIAQQQAETQQKIIDEVKQSGGGFSPVGMVGTPTGPGQTIGPVGMGPDLTKRANGGIVSLFRRF